MPYPLRESISLAGLDLTLFQFSGSGQRQQQQQPGDQETNVVQVTGEPLDVSEEPLVLDTFHLGFGYSWRLLQGTYAYAENADCLPGDALVSISPVWADVKRAVRRWYQGEMVDVTTAGGHVLSTTPNHPVLTNRGWIPLGSINRGKRRSAFSA